MTIQDEVFMAVTAWKENRGGQTEGMQSVINVIVNRARHDGKSPYSECIRRLQFSSMTAPGDPELTLWPADNDPQWQVALGLAAEAAGGTLADITNGSIDYYAPAGIGPANASPVRFQVPTTGELVAFPKTWDRTKITFEAEIAGQLFFREG